MSGELKNRTRLSITLPHELAGRVRELADMRSETISATIERFIASQIDDAEVVSRIARDPLTEAVIDQLLKPENIARAARIVGQATGDPDLMRRREEAIKQHAEHSSGGKP